MPETTTWTRLQKIVPESETQWRAIVARAHRLRRFPGDEACAKTHEFMILEIRSNHAAGSSRQPRFCPRCLARGSRYYLLSIGGLDRCGACHWPDLVQPD